MPSTSRANSMTASCMPKQMPEYGILFRAYAIAASFAVHAALAESAGNQNRVDIGQGFGDIFFFETRPHRSSAHAPSPGWRCLHGRALRRAIYRRRRCRYICRRWPHYFAFRVLRTRENIVPAREIRACVQVSDAETSDLRSKPCSL